MHHLSVSFTELKNTTEENLITDATLVHIVGETFIACTFVGTESIDTRRSG